MGKKLENPKYLEKAFPRERRLLKEIDAALEVLISERRALVWRLNLRRQDAVRKKVKEQPPNPLVEKILEKHRERLRNVQASTGG